MLPNATYVQSSKARSRSAQEGKSRHDTEPNQQEESFEQLVSPGVEFMGEDLQKGDVDERPCRQTLQDSLNQSPGGHVRLYDGDTHADAQRWHHGEDSDVGRHPEGRHGALYQLHRQTEHDDALVDENSDADLQYLTGKDMIIEALFIYNSKIHKYSLP